MQWTPYSARPAWFFVFQVSFFFFLFLPLPGTSRTRSRFDTGATSRLSPAVGERATNMSRHKWFSHQQLREPTTRPQSSHIRTRHVVWSLGCQGFSPRRTRTSQRCLVMRRRIQQGLWNTSKACSERHAPLLGYSAHFPTPPTWCFDALEQSEGWRFFKSFLVSAANMYYCKTTRKVAFFPSPC